MNKVKKYIFLKKCVDKILSLCYDKDNKSIGTDEKGTVDNQLRNGGDSNGQYDRTLWKFNFIRLGRQVFRRNCL